MRRAIILVLDSFGVGATADADAFGDVGADTLGTIARDCRRRFDAGDRQQPLTLPNLTHLGLMHAARRSTGVWPDQDQSAVLPIGAYGCAAEQSSGKDTPSGHWEIAGVPVLFDWGYFTQKEETFPPALLDALIERGGLPGVLGNCHASGTEIIQRLGEAHMASGKPIVYTSADSVFQIAAHEETFGLERLYTLCDLARELVDEYNVGRVIARPFIGDDAASFERTGNRRDLTTPPHEKTLLDNLASAGKEVISVGKISDIFAGQGITQAIKASGNAALIDATLDVMKDAPDRSIVFTNLVDFDMLYGHRRNIEGYATALEYFDARLPEIYAAMQDGDLLVLCADHGCDPGWPGSDHTREHIPVLMYGSDVAPIDLGVRESFSDIGQTIARYLEIAPTPNGVDCFAA
ncbi:MAG: phosphopentomutase [Pseudomonadota bacterium]